MGGKEGARETDTDGKTEAKKETAGGGSYMYLMERKKEKERKKKKKRKKKTQINANNVGFNKSSISRSLPELRDMRDAHARKCHTTLAWRP